MKKSPWKLDPLFTPRSIAVIGASPNGGAGSIVLRNMQRMPGSTGGIVVPTFKHGLTNTLPGLFAAWKRG